MNKNVKNIIVAVALIGALSVPMANVGACSKDHREKPHHSYRHEGNHPKVGSYEYYTQTLHKSTAWYLVNIVKLP